MAVSQSRLGETGSKERLRRTLCGVIDPTAFGYYRLVLMLISHYLLGWRPLREIDDYRNDSIVAGRLGLPSVSALSRLDRAPTAIVDRLRGFIRDGVVERIPASRLRRVTLDFDGTVVSRRRRAEGTAVGYNSHRKGERSYYPLLCTVAQLGEVLDVVHRPGNVRDSRGTAAFISGCADAVRGATPELSLDADADYFELPKYLRPHIWSRAYRVIVVRQQVARRAPGPIQLDLFEPASSHYHYKAIVSDQPRRARGQRGRLP